MSVLSAAVLPSGERLTAELVTTISAMSGTGDAGKSATTDRRDRTVTAAWIGALGAVAAAVIAVLGAHWAGGGSNAVVAPSDSGSVNSTQSRPEPGPVGRTSQRQTGPRVYHEGLLTLADGRSADLDAPPSDVQWGTLSQSQAGVDLVYVSGNLNNYGNGGGMVLLDRTETRPCWQVTGYGGGPFRETDLADGARICLVTNGNRFSLITVVHQSADQSSIQLRIVTFKRDDEP